MNSITQYLESKKISTDFAAIESKKNEWIKALDTLYSQIKDWLGESIEQGAVTDFYSGEIQIVEERTGAYLVPEISFTTANTTIRFIPKGTYVISADGRVDVHATSGRSATLIVQKGQWFFINPGTHRHPTFDEGTFLELLRFLLER